MKSEIQNLDRVAELIEGLNAAIENNQPADTYSFLLGYLSAATNWAVWRNGEQYLGSGFSTIKDLKQAFARFQTDQE